MSRLLEEAVPNPEPGPHARVTEAIGASAYPAPERSRRTRRAAQALWQDKLALIALILLIGVLLMAVFAPLLAPFAPNQQSISNRLMPPAWQVGGASDHLLGTDGLGRDLLSRIIYGARASIGVGVAVVIFAGSIGVFLGLISGYYGGRLGAIIMRVADTQMAFPGLLLVLLVLSVLRPTIIVLVGLLSFNGWMVYARVTRSIVLSARESAYTEAAQMVGCRTHRILRRHILPNLQSPLLTLAVLEFARVLLAEAALSFLGFGVQPPATSWGLDVSLGRTYIYSAWWLVSFPGALIALTVLCTNILASWLRVIGDPEQRDLKGPRAARPGTGL